MLANFTFVPKPKKCVVKIRGGEILLCVTRIQWCYLKYRFSRYPL